jgi:hypothetical protein
MKIFMFVLLLFPFLCIAQRPPIGEALFDTEVFKTLLNAKQREDIDSSLILAVIPRKGYFVCINSWPNGNDHFIKVVYQGKEGYVKRGTVYFRDEQGDVFKEMDNAKETTYFYEAKPTMDRFIDKRHEDSIRAIKNADRDYQLALKQALSDSLRHERSMKTIMANSTALLGVSFPSDDYSVDFKVTISNFDKRPIKYVWATVAAYNPVNDVIKTKTVEMVGPIYKDGSYNFENVFYTKVFDYGKIIKLKIQYMDGKIREIPKAIVDKIIYE